MVPADRATKSQSDNWNHQSRLRREMRRLLDNLDETDRREFVKRARRRSFKAGDKVFWQGDPGDSVHLVVKGSFAASVSTPMSQTVIVNVLRRDDVFGELAVIGVEPNRTATVVALERSETLSVTTAQFEEWRTHCPRIDRLLVQALAVRLREMTEQMLESLYVPVETRVMRRALMLHEALPESSDGWVRIRQEELAAYCGITRPTVNRVLRQLVGQGLIELGRGKFRVCDLPLLDKSASSYYVEY